jgi:peptidoglycan/LPS O-acetylase OafA/YrhL
VLAPVTFLIGGYFLARYMRRNWPPTLSRLLGVLSVAFVVLICVASATRIGYIIYPINFAMWASVTRDAKVLERELVSAAD